MKYKIGDRNPNQGINGMNALLAFPAHRRKETVRIEDL